MTEQYPEEVRNDIVPDDEGEPSPEVATAPTEADLERLANEEDTDG